MTDERRFGLDGEEHSPEPLHYTQCGLDDVYLVNGFSREETDYGPATSIHNVDGLHRVIGLHIVEHKKTISAKEMKFLRRQMDFTQQELGNLMGITDQTIARYEKGESHVTGPVNRLIRIIYAYYLRPPEAQREVLDRLIELQKSDDTMPDHAAYFGTRDDAWEEAPVAA